MCATAPASWGWHQMLPDAVAAQVWAMLAIWKRWYQIVSSLRRGFTRRATFYWFIIALASMTVRRDHRGVASFIRAHGLAPGCYKRLLDHFHSSAFDLDELTRTWVQSCVTNLGDRCIRVGGRLCLVADGIKAPKEGRKMPAVKSLHQESTNNSKPEYIMGHSCQVLSVLASKGHQALAVPLAARIHEGVVLSNRDRRTTHDHLLVLLDSLALPEPVYLVLDAYYANSKILGGMAKRAHQVVTRMRENTVAYYPPEPTVVTKRGRPRKYGHKCHLRALFETLPSDPWTEIDSPIYGERSTKIRYLVLDLLWKPLKGRIIRFVLVDHSYRGRCILACTDTALNPVEIIRLYGLRYKIEVAFRESVHTLGAYSYRFWMKDMTCKQRGDGDDYLHRKSKRYRELYLNKIKAYERYIQTALIAQSLLQLVALMHSTAVWRAYNGWLRTMDPSSCPSEAVTAEAMRTTFPDFLAALANSGELRKFLTVKLDRVRSPLKHRKAA